MANEDVNTINTSGEEEKPEKFLGKFLFTKRTLTFGHKTLQLNNVTKIEVRRFQETKKAVHSISPERLRQAWKIVAAGVLLTLLGGYWESLRLIGILLVLAGGGIIWYYYDERKKIKDITYNYFGLFFDSASGKTEVLWSDYYDFVVKIFDQITNSMNYEQVNSFVANFTDNSIKLIDSDNNVIQSSIEAGTVSIGHNEK